MISRLYKLLFIVLVVALALYIVLLNQEVMTIRLTSDSPISANAGVIMIATFVSGMFFMALIALWFGMKSYFRERGMLSREKQRQAFYSNMLKARSYLAAEEWAKAREQWEQMIRKDPTDIIARVELSRSVQGLAHAGQAELLDALKVLDAARTADPKNTEVLFRAAELNLALKNKTAALDNLALILYHHPNKRAAKMARDVSEELERYADAFEYQKQLESLDYDSDHTGVVARLRYKQLAKENEGDKVKLTEALKTFIRQNPGFPAAISHLAAIELENGKKEEAAQLFVKAAKIEGLNSSWHNAARIWIKGSTPDKAVSAARGLSADSTGVARINAEIELIRLYVALNMLEDAKKLCDGFPALVKRENVQLSRENNTTFLALKGLCLSRAGDYKQAADIFKKICEQDFNMDEFTGEQNLNIQKEAPAPRLSTP